MPKSNQEVVETGEDAAFNRCFAWLPVLVANDRGRIEIAWFCHYEERDATTSDLYWRNFETLRRMVGSSFSLYEKHSYDARELRH